MADFNVDVAGAPSGGSIIQPVQNTSVASGIAALGNLFVNTGDSVKSALVAGAKQQVNIKSLEKLNSIRENLLIKNDAVAQGKWSSRAAGTAVRKQLANDLANHPELTEDIMGVYKETLGTAVLGGAITNGTQEEKDRHDAKLKVFQDMLAAGVGDADLDPESPEAEQLMDQFQGYRLNTTQLEHTAKQLAVKRAQIGLQTDVVQLASAKQSLVTGGITQKTARLNLAEKQAEVQSRAAVTGAASAYHQLLSKKLAKTYDSWKAGKITAQEASLQIDQDTAQVFALANSNSPSAGGEYIKNVLSPITGLSNSFKEAVTGKIDADALQNQLNATTNKAILMQIHNNPKSLNVISALRTFPNMPTPVLEKMTSDAFKMIGWDVDTGEYKGPDLSGAMTGPSGSTARASAATTPNNKAPMPNFITGDKEDVRGATSWIKTSIENVLGGVVTDKDAISEINNMLFTVAKSTIKYGKSAEGSKDYNEVLDLLSGSSFAAYVKSGKLHYSDGDAQAMADVISQSYDRDVVPIIKKEFIGNSVITGNKSLPLTPGSYAAAQGLRTTTVGGTADNIAATFDGKGIRFIPNDPSNASLVNKASRLNEVVKPSFDRFIKAQANLKGTPLKTEYEIYMAAIDPGASDRKAE